GPINLRRHSKAGRAERARQVQAVACRAKSTPEFPHEQAPPAGKEHSERDRAAAPRFDRMALRAELLRRFAARFPRLRAFRRAGISPRPYDRGCARAAQSRRKDTFADGRATPNQHRPDLSTAIAV